MTDTSSSSTPGPGRPAPAPRKRRTWRRLFLFLFLGFGLLLFFGLFFGGPVLPNSMVLVLDVRSEVPERTDQDFFQLILEQPERDLITVRRAFRRAAMDPRVRGLLVRVGSSSMGFGRVEEFRALIQEFESSGKFVVSVLESADTLGYFLATSAQRVFMDRSSTLHFVGVGMQAYFLGDALREFHVEPDFVRVGDYKGAYEEVMGSQPSEEFQRSMNETLDSLFATLVSGIADARGTTFDEVRTAIDQGPFDHVEAVAAKLVDKALYQDEVGEYLRRVGGSNLESVTISRYVKEGGFQIPGRVALIHVDGMIVDNAGSSAGSFGGSAGANLVVPAIRDARESDDIVGLVVRVNSPGGMLSASEAIWRELSITRGTKPVVVTMGDVAASGGYYVAMGADYVFARSGTVTGSIGIFGGKIVIGGVLERFKVNEHRATRGNRAGIYDVHRKFDDDERLAIEKMLRAGYDQFLERVSKARSKNVAEVDAVAQGRVWTGEQALERGLVDGIGGTQEAFLKVCELAGVAAEEEGEMVLFPRERSLVELLIDDNTAGGSYLESRQELLESVFPGESGISSEVARVIRAMWQVGFLDGRNAMVMLPFAVSIR
jgi:protease-4